MTINIEITATPQLSALAASHAACFAKSWSKAEFAQMLTIKGTVAFVTEGGFALVRLIAREAELLTIAVKPAMQRQGIGSALLKAIHEWLRGQEADILFLDVRESNQAALGMYGKATPEFTVISRRRNYYTNQDGSQETAIVMRCEIIHPVREA